MNDWTQEPAESVGSQRLASAQQYRRETYAAAVKADPRGVAAYNRNINARLQARRDRHHK
jgi:hypothetical protein